MDEKYDAVTKMLGAVGVTLTKYPEPTQPGA
jgi:hypothetical protein